MEKFTVIIPTRERAEVLGPALKTVTTQDYDRLEIIVSDNFSSDSTREVVESFDDPRITYLNTGRRISMSHNWEFALSHVKEGWVSIIGDDDGLLPNAIAKAAEIARSTEVQAIGSRNATYSWPHPPEQVFGTLSIHRKRGVEVRDSKSALNDLCRGRIPYSNLPMLYTGGFIDSGLIEKARKISGKFYRSMIPDVYSSVVFSKLTDRHVFSDTPLAIGGTSVHSGGTSYMSGKAKEQKPGSPGAKFIEEENIPFPPALLAGKNNAFPPSIELIVYESILQAEHIPPSCMELTNHVDQLARIIGKAKSRHRDAIDDWSVNFSRLHDIDLAAVRRKAMAIKLYQKIAKTIRKIRLEKETIEVFGTSQRPISDVYSASVLADEIIGGKVKGF